MTGAISGVNPQQAAYAKTFQPDGSEQQDRVARNREQQDEQQNQNSIQVKGTAASQSELIEESRERRDAEKEKTESRSQNLAANNNMTQRRGSLVDVVV